jgi:DNA (cytosine-5)-methyltransferase 1
MSAYYNENDPYCAQWLRNLIDRGLIAPGDVDDRSIEDVQAKDLDGYQQCHFFAGIGGWSYALRLAGIPDDYPVWTGSCPCQDFSLAGKQAGFEGTRDLWPAWFRLIQECRPDVLFGEQVDDSLEWYDRTAADLENLDYPVGACVVPACAVGALHERARLWFGSHAVRGGRERFGPAEKESWSREQLAGLVQAEARMAVPAGKDCALAHGVPARVGRLRAYGNAIVPQVAAEFIAAYMESTPCR